DPAGGPRDQYGACAHAPMLRRRFDPRQSAVNAVNRTNRLSARVEVAAMPTATQDRRRELGEFLRSRRARRSPEDAGLPHGPRRRTPGLRREEVAAHAGMSVTWYTWLEQGRPARVSRQVLDSLARVLSLDAVEHRHLLELAGETPPNEAPPPQVGP